MKRFYKTVSIGPDFTLLLDDKPVKTQNGSILRCHTKDVAEIARIEWDDQEDDVNLDTMPMMHLLSTIMDTGSEQRIDITNRLCPYLDTDLICYRTVEPAELAKQQAAIWDRWIDWFSDNYNTRLEITTGLSALKQDYKAHKKVGEFINCLDIEHFTVLQIVTQLTGSLVLGLAFLKGDASIEEAFDACHIEEKFKAEIYDENKYGPDPLQEKKDKAMLADLNAAAAFLKSRPLT